MDIKVLGMGCPKCNRLAKMARDVVANKGVTASFFKVDDMDQIMAYGVAITPALVIDGEVKCSGRLPSKQEIASWISKE